MALETGTRINDLVATNPLASDPAGQGDDHLRLIKACVQGTLPNMGAIFGQARQFDVPTSLSSTWNTNHIFCTASATATVVLTLPPVTSVTSGFYMDITALAGAAISLVPSGGFINGAASLSIPERSTAHVFCISGGWRANVMPTGLGGISVLGDTQIKGALSVSGAAHFNTTVSVGGAATLGSTLTVSGAATMLGTLSVSGAAHMNTTLSVGGATTLGGTLTVSAGATLLGTLSVSGAAHFNTTVSVGGAATLGSTLTVSGAAVLLGTLNVAGLTDLGQVVVHGGLSTSGAAVIGGTFRVLGAASFVSNVQMNSTLSVSGAAHFNTTVSVGGAATLASTLSVSGAAHFNTTVSVGGAATLGGTLTVSAATVLNGGLTVLGGASINGATTISGVCVVKSAVSIGGTVVMASTLTVAGAATISGATTLNGTLTVSGTVAFTGLLNLGGNLNLNNGTINFPAVQNPSAGANTLDDYEEGTWTPSINYAVTGDLNTVYSTQSGTYTKIGRLVTASFSMVTSTYTHTTATGAMGVLGFPFTPTFAAHGTLSYDGMLISTGANYDGPILRMASGTTTAAITKSGINNNARADLDQNSHTSGTNVTFDGTISYQAS